MNVANLQIEGLIMALAYTHRALVGKGILSAEQIEHALHKAEASLTAEERLFQDMTPAIGTPCASPYGCCELQTSTLQKDIRSTSPA
jgi:hypothetical protein